MAILPVSGVGQTGLNKDLSVHELPINAWTDALNIRFLDGYASQFLGHEPVYGTPLNVPQHILPCNVSGARYWIYTTAANAYCVTITGGAAVHTDITHVTPRTGVTNNWTSTLLSGVPVFNAGDTSSYPMAWSLNTAAKFVDLSSWPATTYCKSIRAFKNFLIALNITKGSSNYPYMVKWSSPADPGALPASWDPTDATQQAGEVDLAEGYDAIIDGLQLGNSFIIYKENSIWRMDFAGGNYIFQFTKVLGKSGAMNRNCIADVNGFHVVLTGNDIIAHDGQTSTSVLDKAMRRWLFRSIDSANSNLCFLFVSPFFNECFICYPAIGSSVCNKAVVYNYKDSTCSVRDLPSVNHAAYGAADNSLTAGWNADVDAWDADLTCWNGPEAVPATARCLCASTSPALYMLDVSATFNGVTPVAYLERRGLSLNNPSALKLVRSIRPRITGSTGQTVLVSVGWSDDPYSDPVYDAPMVHTIGSTVSNDCTVVGRYIAIKFSSGTAAQWRLDSYDIDFMIWGAW